MTDMTILKEYKEELKDSLKDEPNIDIHCDEIEECVICFQSNIWRAVYRCLCKPKIKICCGCYLKIIDAKCPCCRQGI